ARGNGLCTPNTTTWMVESGDWDTNINWSGNAVPDECSDVVIPDQVSEAIVTTPNSVDINIHLLEVGLNVVFSVPLGTTLSILTK
ncbi:MAG: hypothetical protein HKN76_21095, partial [Saprospiraceae bacterium]|nr:hypothetical protein [Saprospiraceae bacterium]